MCQVNGSKGLFPIRKRRFAKVPAHNASADKEPAKAKDTSPGSCNEVIKK